MAHFNPQVKTETLLDVICPLLTGAYLQYECLCKTHVSNPNLV